MAVIIKCFHLHCAWSTRCLRFRSNKKKASYTWIKVCAFRVELYISSVFVCKCPMVWNCAVFTKNASCSIKRSWHHIPTDFAKSFIDISFTQRFILLKALIIICKSCLSYVKWENSKTVLDISLTNFNTFFFPRIPVFQRDEYWFASNVWNLGQSIVHCILAIALQNCSPVLRC